MLFLFSDFNPQSSNEASKISSVLSILAKNEEAFRAFDLSCIDDVVSKLADNFKHNEKVTESMLLLSISETLRTASVEKWVGDLASIIMSDKVGLHHLEAVRTLYKRRDAALLDAFKAIKSISEYYSIKSHEQCNTATFVL